MNKPEIFRNFIMLLGFVVYFLLWKSFIVFYIMAFLLYLSYFIFRKPNRKQILSNSLGLIVFWIVIFIVSRFN
jgi:hypothetical protein